MAVVRDYLQLTKPTIVLLVVITALAALAAQGSLFSYPFEAFLVVLAIGMAAGSANAFNQFLDRDIDSVMARTREKRPLPSGRVKPYQAFLFAAALGAASTLYLWMAWNPLAAIVSAATILFYTLVYTLVLKRRHYYNIVIGGAAGAAGPLIAWAAFANSISAYAWLLFAIIFFWTPAHFWALALAIKDEYKEVNVPMLPVVKGEERTRWEIWAYTYSLLPLSVIPYLLGMTSFGFLVSALILWTWYLYQTKIHLRSATKKSYLKLFYVSILYLFALFLAVGADGAFRHFIS